MRFTSNAPAGFTACIAVLAAEFMVRI